MSGLMQFFRGQNKTLRTALFVAAFLSGVAFGQSEVGQINGRVADPNGAVVPGAIVKVKSVETGIERTATVDGDGFYTIRGLPPGVYEVDVQAQGFVARTQRVRIIVGSLIRFDPQLSVAPVTAEETVIENTGGAEVNKQTGQISDPITQRQLNELPTITRDPYSLITLSGNVTPFQVTPLGVNNLNPTLTSPNVITSPFQDFAIDGQAPTTNNVRLDGGENLVNYWSTLGQRIPLAGVQDINVITNGFRPQYGRFLGGLIDVASIPGGNDWHGQVYYFYRGSALATNTFDNNARGIPRGHLVGNQPGYGVGGPIIKDKLFFFSSTEGIIQRSRVDRVAFVPTADFLSPVTNPAISPATTAYFAAFPLATPINGPVLTVSDTLALLGTTTTPLGLFSGLPATLPAFGTVFFNTQNDWGAGFPQDTLFTVNRLDYTLSDRTLIYGRYAYVDRDIYTGAFGFSPFAGFNTGIGELNHNAQINWLQTLSAPGCCASPGTSPWFMNVKAQYERINISRNIGASTFGPRLFLTGYPASGFGGVPSSFPGDQPFAPGLNSLLTGPLNLGQVAVDFFGAWGNNQLRFGASYYYWQDNRNINSFQNGEFTLGGGVPAALDFLVGGVSSTFSTAINPFGVAPGGTVTLPVVQPDFNRSISAHDFSAYISDIWRVSPRVSVLLGLRWDYFGVPRSRNDQIFSNYFLGPGADVFTQVANGVFVPPGAPLPPGSPAFDDERFFERDFNNFAPRLGVAWDIMGRTGNCCQGRVRTLTLRAGYGMTYERLFYATSPFFQFTPGFAIPSLTAGVPNPFPPPATIPATTLSTSNFGPLGGAAGAAILPPTLIRGIQSDLDTPHVHFWNVSLESELAANTYAALRYVGAAGRELFTLSNINRPGSAAAFLGSPDPTARLNPLFGPIFFLTTDGKSNYNAFIAEVTNGTWRTLGLQFTARYRFSKALDNVSSIFGNNIGTFGNSFTTNLLSPFDPENDYGPADWDANHRFVGSFSWEVPFDWFSNRCCGGSNGWGRHVFGGWQVAGIGVVQSGLPFTVFNCTGAATAETPCPRAGIAPGVVISDIAKPGAGNAIPSTTIPNFFNFLGSGNFTIPTAGAVLPPFPANTPGRNLFRGPNFWNFDFGVYKRFRITEDVSVQIRSEFYNIFNNANMFAPNGVDIGANPFVPAFKNGARFIQFGAKFLF